MAKELQRHLPEETSPLGACETGSLPGEAAGGEAAAPTSSPWISGIHLLRWSDGLGRRISLSPKGGTPPPHSP
ncbi:hypothetical protein, partial [Roseomonas populi]